MKLNSYNPVDGSLLTSDTTSVDFGSVIQGYHNTTAVVVQPYDDTESLTISNLAMFLEDRGSFASCAFGKFSSGSLITGIEPGDNYLSDNFTAINGVSDFTNYSGTSDLGLVLNTECTDYVWLDVEIGTSQSAISGGTINYRVVFEYA